MTTALPSHHYGPSLNLPAPLSRQNRQPRRSEAEPRWVVLTHFHADHAGSAAEIAAWGSGVPVLAHQADAAYLRGAEPVHASGAGATRR
jgi:glyoxylase-like metal-dependent hydrolase (beta-lactamase superfamily II)